MENNLHRWRPITAMIGQQLLSVHVSHFKAISLMRAIAVTDAPPALPNKVLPLIFMWDCNLCTEVWKDNCGCNRYLFSSQRVEGNYSAPSRWINCQIHLNAAATWRRLCFLTSNTLVLSLCNCLWLSPSRAIYPKLTKLSNYRIIVRACGK